MGTMAGTTVLCTQYPARVTTDANYLLRLLVRSSIGSNNRIRGRKGTCRQVREDKDKKKDKGTKTMIKQRQRHTKNNDKENINTNKNKDKGHGWSQG